MSPLDARGDQRPTGDQPGDLPGPDVTEGVDDGPVIDNGWAGDDGDRRLFEFEEDNPEAFDDAAALDGRVNPDWAIGAREATAMLRAWLPTVLHMGSNTLFAEAERSELLKQIGVLQSEVMRLHQVNEHQAREIQRILSEAGRAGEDPHLGKKDWLMIAIGLGASLAVQELVPSLVLLHLGARAVHLLGHLFARAG